ncbi:acyltransferase [Spirulina sp. 06S082]|uniref:acyltransferase family protein n=1 Tax=Spirulina sp. 06S082 TaxID=3110248 RepID=UPI002B1F63DA|nr:acyltransferase [Spirulina sp. 06S082]MEA5468574.1 acyltransferase [Spirulina sp. 06S082]
MQKKIEYEAKQLNLIQLFRGLAAIAVVLYHVDLCSYEQLNKSFFFDIFEFGLSGVDYFFVLSGFVIIYTQHRSFLQQSFKKFKLFLLKRLIRIIPIYWFINLCILLVLVVFPMLEAPNPITLGFTIRSFLLIPQNLPPINNVAWTLTLILFFYFVFSLNYILPRRFYFAIVAMIIFASATQFISAFFISPTEYPRWKLIFNSLNLEFVFGCIAAYIVLNYSLKYRKIIFFLGLISFLFFGFAQAYNLIDEVNIIKIWGIDLMIDRTIFLGIPCLFLVMGAALIDIQEGVNIPNVLLYLGDASYSIYLAHSPLVYGLFQLSSLFKLNRTIGNSDILGWLIAIAAIAISCIFYNLIEKPLTSYLRKQLIPQR